MFSSGAVTSVIETKGNPESLDPQGKIPGSSGVEGPESKRTRHGRTVADQEEAAIGYL